MNILVIAPRRFSLSPLLKANNNIFKQALIMGAELFHEFQESAITPDEKQC